MLTCPHCGERALLRLSSRSDNTVGWYCQAMNCPGRARPDVFRASPVVAMRDWWCEVRPDVAIQPLFLGGGHHSKQAAARLHTLLDEVILHLGGIQQPPACTEPEANWVQWEESSKAARKRINLILLEICAALAVS